MKFLVFFLLFGLNAFSQENGMQVNLGVRYSKIDFFLEPSVVISKVKIRHEFGLGVGVNRTFTQMRFFPQVNYSLMSNFKAFHNFQVQGIASYYLSAYNPNKFERELHFFNEFLLGFNFSYGNRFKTFIEPKFGLLNESFHSDLHQKILSFSTFSYSFKFGFSYVL
ncbi:MAG: hypothetical protein ACK5B9_04745 [Flavobacteriia bacterium]|jgi:hypothetical protein